MDASNRSKCQLIIIVDAADGPDAANVAQVSSVHDLCTHITAKFISTTRSKYHHMAVRHAHGNLGEVIECAHAVDALRHLNCLQEFQ